MMRHTNDHSILPVWEDKENVKGGEWVFRSHTFHSPQVWLELTMAVIGEQYEGFLDSELICGVSVTKKPKDFVFKVWHSKMRSEYRVMKRTREIISQGFSTDTTGFIMEPFHKKHSK